MTKLHYAKGRRIFWIHGAQDWMFPVGLARHACSLLGKAGAKVSLRVIGDLAHAYPRDQNEGILTWFDPKLALPASDVSRVSEPNV